MTCPLAAISIEHYVHTGLLDTIYFALFAGWKWQLAYSPGLVLDCIFIKDFSI